MLFAEFTNVVSILLYNFIEFIILLYTFFVTSFARFKDYMSCLILLSNFSDSFPAFTWASAISNRSTTCLELSILSPLRFFGY